MHDSNDSRFADFRTLYADHPPVVVDKISGELMRNRGASHRNAFWAGYDLLKGGMYPPTRNLGYADTAYRAGVSYRRCVDAGQRDPLPAK